MIVDLSDVRTSAGLHRKLKIYFGFPDMYGMNWDAFWDAITGLVELPDEITFTGWEYLEKVLPNDARIMRDVFDEYITDPYHSHKVIRFE